MFATTIACSHELLLGSTIVIVVATTVVSFLDGLTLAIFAHVAHLSTFVTFSFEGLSGCVEAFPIFI